MTADAIIVGGGVVGCAIAHFLARARLGRVVVLERGQPGEEASGAAAGVLAVASSRAPGGALFDLRRTSAAMFPALVEELEKTSGTDLEYRKAGLLELAFRDDELADLGRLAARRVEQSFDVRLLDAGALRSLEPEVSSDAVGAILCRDDRSVHAQRFVAALRCAATAAGAEFLCNAPLEAAESSGGRILALRAGTLRLTPGTVVVTAGVWSREVGELFRVRVPVRPDKGEMVALRGAAVPTRTIVWDKGYLVPRGNGEVLVGSTSARGVSDKSTTARSLALLLNRALRMVPGLGNAAIVRTWAGLRPCPTIRRPIIGRVPGFENLVLAAGHHRSGILLAPITAQLVTEMIRGEPPSVALEPFSYRPR